jgi:hypothetical protein
MRNVELVRSIQRLRNLIGRVDAATANEIELQAHWARYVCVLAAGVLENSVPALYGAYVSTKASPAVAKFASATLSAVNTPKSHKFLEIAGRFDEQWNTDLQGHLDENGRREAIDSIIANRHLIAHGKDSGITLARVKEYLEKSIEVLEFIETQCGV